MAGRAVVTKCFISYTRRDNDAFDGVVDRLRTEVSARFAAETGRELEIFVDRESIGWGQNWRERIRDSVNDATFFIPVITMSFFNSDPCREELRAFHETADRLGVTDLIMPIMLAGSAEITPDHPDDLVRLVEQLNHVALGEAWNAGYDSSAWRSTVAGMVKGLIAALGRAEEALVDREQMVKTTEEEESVVEGDFGSLYDDVNGLTADMKAATVEMNRLGEVAKDLMNGVPASASPTQRQSALVRKAGELAVASEAFASAASAVERRATRTDAQLRAIFEELREIEFDAAQEGLDTIRQSLRGMPDLDSQVVAIDQAMGGLRLAAMSNVSVRRAMQPAIRALQSMRGALATVRSWSLL